MVLSEQVNQLFVLIGETRFMITSLISYSMSLFVLIQGRYDYEYKIAHIPFISSFLFMYRFCTPTIIDGVFFLLSPSLHFYGSLSFHNVKVIPTSHFRNLLYRKHVCRFLHFLIPYTYRPFLIKFDTLVFSEFPPCTNRTRSLSFFFVDFPSLFTPCR